ncbi:hypothetical protein H6764_01380 [Candidatus Nomurabacteria bacterium]|nr:hypothetical protein [Candidatus Nomurabacteria bacterium]
MANSDFKFPEDLNQIFNLTKDQVMQIASDLETQGDADSKEIAEMLRGLDDDFFKLTKGQDRLTKLIEFLKSRGVSEETVLDIVGKVTDVALLRSEDKISKAMPPEVKAKWNNLLLHKPNVLQQFVLLNHFCEAVMQKTFDDVFDAELETATKELTQAIEKESEIVMHLSQLPKEDFEKVVALFDEGNEEEAIALIYQAKKNANAQSISQS